MNYKIFGNFLQPLGLNVFSYLRTANRFRQTDDLEGEKSDGFPPAEVRIWAVSNKS